MRFDRITVDPAQLGGVACIRRLRIPVATVVGLVAQGMPESEIMDEYPDLEVEDIRQALAFAATAARSCGSLPHGRRGMTSPKRSSPRRW